MGQNRPLGSPATFVRGVSAPLVSEAVRHAMATCWAYRSFGRPCERGYPPSAKAFRSRSAVREAEAAERLRDAGMSLNWLDLRDHGRNREAGRTWQRSSASTTSRWPSKT